MKIPRIWRPTSSSVVISGGPYSCRRCRFKQDGRILNASCTTDKPGPDLPPISYRIGWLVAFFYEIGLLLACPENFQAGQSHRGKTAATGNRLYSQAPDIIALNYCISATVWLPDEGPIVTVSADKGYVAAAMTSLISARNPNKIGQRRPQPFFPVFLIASLMMSLRTRATKWKLRSAFIAAIAKRAYLRPN